MEESESDAGAASGGCFRVIASTVAACAGSREPPQAEQDWLVEEFSVAHAGQVTIDQFLKPDAVGNRVGLIPERTPPDRRARGGPPCRSRKAGGRQLACVAR